MVNIRDVAKKAQVSPGTVSRILNNDSSLSVNEKTRKRVYQVCEELQYIPRKYKNRNQQNSIGIISAISREEEMDDLYYRQIREKVIQSAKEMDYRVDFMIHLPNLENSWERVKEVNCVIVMGYIHQEIHQQIYQLNSHMIIVDDYYCSPEYSSVSVDFHKEMLGMLDHVYAMGHQRIAFIGGKNQRLTLNKKHVADGLGDREQAYSEWIADHKMENYHRAFIGEQWYAQTGYDLTDKLLSEKKELPTVIIAASDMLALGVLRRLNEENIQVPKNISICSFDDLEMAAFLTPSLTTQKIDIDTMVSWIMKLCQNMMNEENNVPTRIVISGKLVERESLQEVNKMEIL
ncbi:LacI family transcriptional regulator [Enterococcus sp. AZ194]|uniref:LacI family DNA-binding transcriptional regulator n=1 Tax=Enterococcus sp. AZ194 TaxID=2774629 RepID=UPI003F27AC1D